MLSRTAKTASLWRMRLQPINHERQHFSLFRFVVCFVIKSVPQFESAVTRDLFGKLRTCGRGRELVGAAVRQQQRERELSGVRQGPLAGLQASPAQGGPRLCCGLTDRSCRRGSLQDHAPAHREPIRSPCMAGRIRFMIFARVIWLPGGGVAVRMAGLVAITPASPGLRRRA